MKRSIKTTVSTCLIGAVLLGAVGSVAFAAGVFAQRGTSKVTIDGKSVRLEGYVIDGHNYFRLRDVAEAVGFGVSWNNATGTVEIDTTSGYVPEKPAAGKQTGATNGKRVSERLTAFHDLDMEVGIADMYVQTGKEYALTLESSGADRSGVPYELHYKNENGKLSIWSTPEKLSTDGKPTPNGKVVVTLPEGAALEKVSIENGMGDLKWSGCGLTERLECDLGMGDAILSGSLRGDIDLDLGMGNAELSGDMSGDIDLDLGMGDAEVSGKLTGNIRIDNGMGDIWLDLDQPASSYSYQLNAMSIRLNGEKQYHQSVKGGNGGSTLRLSCGMGDISLTFGG